MNSGWTLSALRGVLLTSGVTALVAMGAGLVRILPWVLDPQVTWRVAAPFARTLGVVAAEASVAVGWPLGWALATLAFVEGGESRVLRLLGERPARTTARLGGQACAFAALLAGFSWASAHESTEPGRIVSELIADGEAACHKAEVPRTYTVPFFGATWLCVPGRAPRLVGQGPGRLQSLAFSARAARVSGDLGSLELDDAHLHVAAPNLSLHVDRLRLRAGAPWGHASSVPPLSRALALTSAITLAALAGVALLLTGRVRGLIVTVAVAVSGPLVALGTLRAVAVLERPGARPAWLVVLVVAVPALALLAPIALAWAIGRVTRAVGRLPAPRPTAST